LVFYEAGRRSPDRYRSWTEFADPVMISGSVDDLTLGISGLGGVE
jgi:hypothetical protein